MRALIGWLGVVAALLAWLVFDDGHRGLQAAGLAAAVVVAVAHLIVMPQWRYNVHRWEVAPQAVYTRSGWLHQESRIAPISRIQTVDSERGPLEQLFGLADVTVTTASAAGPLKIEGLDRATAERLVDELTDRRPGYPGRRHVTAAADRRLAAARSGACCSSTRSRSSRARSRRCWRLRGRQRQRAGLCGAPPPSS